MKKLLSILCISSLFANFTINESSVSIDSDASIIVEGDFINNGSVTNNGYLEIIGLYSGDGSLTNSGTILFNNEMGDATLNGSIDIGDIVLLVEYIVGQYELTDFQIALSDLNSSEHINVTDVILLIELVLTN